MPSIQSRGVVTNLRAVPARWPPACQGMPDWYQQGLRYFSYHSYLKQRFGRRVHKVSLDAGFTCPNVDGTVAVGGCVFCDNESFSPSRRLPKMSVADQLAQGITALGKRMKAGAFLAYFQPATNTYAPAARLRPLFEQALAHPQVVGLAVGTRPDCLPDDTLDMLEELAQERYVSLELGMQSMHDASLDWMNRGHHHASFLDAVARCRHRGLELCAHVILGIPGEDRWDMLATARELAQLRVDAVKIHNLYVVEGTPLAAWVRSGEVQLLERDAYVGLLVDFLELLPPDMVVERISGDAPPDYFVGPAWCLDKTALREEVLAEFAQRDTYQGRRFAV